MLKYFVHFLVFATTVTIVASIYATKECTINEFAQVVEVTQNCADIVIKNLHVPSNTTLFLNLKDGSKVEFRGNLTFGYFQWKGPLVVINGKNLYISGETGHRIDGQGEKYWDGLGGNGVPKPKFIELNVDNTVMENIQLFNCPVHCISINGCHNLNISNWLIDISDGNKNNQTGHNTDGFDVSGSHIIIKDSHVINQDDCVVINRGHDIVVENMRCETGHGLSISVGFDDDNFESNSVRNVIFSNSQIIDSANGIHVKTHADSGVGIIDNIVYKNIELSRIQSYGINIQQDYVNGEGTGVPGTNIPILGLKIADVTGTMAGNNTLATYILCGDGACFDWDFSNININNATNSSSCNYVPEGFTC